MAAPARRPGRSAFRLSQLGTVATGRFGDRVAELGLSAPEAGALRLLDGDAGISQRTLATRLRAAPSRVVALIDSLEAKGLVVRRRSRSDRRNHELHLTETGQDMLGRLRAVAEAHEAEIVRPLTAAERDRLATLLDKLARAHGLDARVHPGYSAARPGAGTPPD